MDTHTGDKHYQVLFYWTPNSEEEVKHSKHTKLFTSYEKAREYVLQQEFDSLNEPDLIEINEWTQNQWGFLDYSTTILRGIRKGLNIKMFDLNKIREEIL